MAIASTRALTPYDSEVIRQIARRQQGHSWWQLTLEQVAVPLSWLTQVARRLPGSRYLQQGAARLIERSAGQLTRIARVQASFDWTCSIFALAEIPVDSWNTIRALPLAQLDRVSSQVPSSWAYGAVEGGLLGLMQGITDWAWPTWVALGAGDISASLWLGARDASRIAACYGFDPGQDEFLPHLMASMIPAKDWESGQFVGLKALLSHPWGTRQWLAPLFDLWSQRTTVVLADKELTTVLPVAGAVINASLNAAYLRGLYESAHDYFRLLNLSTRYPPELVYQALTDAQRAPVPPTRTAGRQTEPGMEH